MRTKTRQEQTQGNSERNSYYIYKEVESELRHSLQLFLDESGKVLSLLVHMLQ